MIGSASQRVLIVLLPVAIAFGAVAWIASGSGGSDTSGPLGLGVGVLLAVWFAWAAVNGVIARSLLQTGRALGPVWVLVQLLQAAALLVGVVPLLTSEATGSPTAGIAAVSATAVIPIAVFALSAAQSIVLFFRA